MTACTNRLNEAFAYAHHLHQQQKRKGTDIPYISHLMAVASLALEHGGSEGEAIAALLHDAAEDQGGEPTLAEIWERFGSEVAEIVRACSDSLVASGEAKQNWRQRKQAYMERIAQESPSTQLVSACDKLHNARSLLQDYRQHGEDLWERFKGGKDGTLWYYRALVEALRRADRLPRQLLGELERTVSALEQESAAPVEKI
jgi:GTP pyrophosphokinase